MRFDFMIVDVFTDVAFGGNQLAVLTDARGLSGEAMQTITREFDFPETTFLLPPKDARNARAVRIFTPGRELPFAGHPTVGTACALVMSGACEAGEIILEEGVGPIPVATTKSGESYTGRFRLERSPEVPDQVPSHADMAAVLSLEPGEIVDVFGAGMGVNFTFVQVADREAVDRSALDHPAPHRMIERRAIDHPPPHRMIDRSALDHPVWRRVLADQWGTQVHVFAGELKDGAEIYARMYGPAFGIAEDAATGSAAAAIAGAAALRAGSSLKLDIRQGVKMGRPSLIRTSASIEDGQLRAIEVGGGCAFVAQGQIEVPGHFLEKR